MPRYDFMCEKGQRPFELIMTISERGTEGVPEVQNTKVVPRLVPGSAVEERGDRMAPCQEWERGGLA